MIPPDVHRDYSYEWTVDNASQFGGDEFDASVEPGERTFKLTLHTNGGCAKTERVTLQIGAVAVRNPNAFIRNAMITPLPGQNPGLTGITFDADGKHVGEMPKGDKDALSEDTDSCMSCGIFNSTGFVSDPIDLASGHLFDLVGDLYLDSIGSRVLFARNYQSDRSTPGMLGRGWRHVFERKLVFAPGSNATEIDELGMSRVFPENGQGGYLTATGHPVDLSLGSDGFYSVTYPTKNVFRYNASGTLVAIVDPNGNATNVEYGSDGMLSRVVTASGQAMTFESLNGHITKASILGVMSVQYAYEGDDLRAVVGSLGDSTFYTYDANGQMLSNQRADGSVTGYTYQGDKVVQLRSQDASGAHVSTTQLEYPTETSRRLTDAKGNVTAFEYDTKGFLIRRTAPDGAAVTMDRNDQGQITKVTYPDGTFETYSYDSEGRVFQHTTRDGRASIVDRDPITGWPTALTRPDGSLQSKDVDASGNISATIDPLGRRTTIARNAAGLVTKLIEANGAPSETFYDANGQIASSKNALGQVVSFQRDSLGRVTRTTSPLGRANQTEYTGKTLVSSQTDALGQRTSFDRDPIGRVIGTVLPNGARTEQAWSRINGRDVVTESKNPVGAVTRTEHDVLGHVSATVDPLGRRTAFERDSRGRVTKTTFPDGSTSQTFYTIDGLVDYTKDAAGRETHNVYDTARRHVATIFPDGTSSQTVYDSMNRVKQTIGPDGATSTTEYDLAGEAIASVDALGHRSQSVYGTGGDLEKTVDALGRETRFEHDLLHRVTKVTTPLGLSGTSEFNADGEQTATVSPGGHRVEMTFDALGRVTAVKNPLGFSVKTSFDSVGQVTQVEDENHHVWKMEWDLAGRKTKEIDPNNRAVIFAYNLAGELTKKTMQDGSSIEMAYDSMGRCTQRVYKRADGSVEDADTLEYNIVGQRVLAENAAVRIQSSYDLMDRETRRVILFKATGTTRTLMFSYDAAGRRTLFSDGTGREVRYTWNLGGQLTQLAIHDPGRHPHGMTDRLYSMTYNAVGSLTEVRYPNGTRTRRVYDLDERLQEIAHERMKKPRGGGVSTDVDKVLADYRYTRDADSNITKIKEQDGDSWEFAYDKANQLVEATMPKGLFNKLKSKDDRIRGNAKKGVFGTDDPDEIEAILDQLEDSPKPARTVRWDYDPAGNRTLELRDGQGIVSTYSPANELKTAGQARYTHTPRGDLATKTLPSGRQLAYGTSVAGQMTSFSRVIPGKAQKNKPAPPPTLQLVESYSYDPDRQRVGLNQARSRKHTDFAWLDGRVIEEMSRGPGRNSPLDSVRYQWGAGGLLEQERVRFRTGNDRDCESDRDDDDDRDHDDDDDDGVRKDLGAIRFALFDHLGSTRLLTGTKGEIRERTEWGPWGELLKGGKESRIGYTGHQTERASGMHYSVHRYLDSRNARWTQRDPMGAVDGQNRYVYVENSPVNMEDPFGLFQLSADSFATASPSGYRHGRPDRTKQDMARRTTLTLAGIRVQKSIEVLQSANECVITPPALDRMARAYDNVTLKYDKDLFDPETGERTYMLTRGGDARALNPGSGLTTFISEAAFKDLSPSAMVAALFHELTHAVGGSEEEAYSSGYRIFTSPDAPLNKNFRDIKPPYALDGRRTD